MTAATTLTVVSSTPTEEECTGKAFRQRRKLNCENKRVRTYGLWVFFIILQGAPDKNSWRARTRRKFCSCCYTGGILKPSGNKDTNHVPGILLISPCDHNTPVGFPFWSLGVWCVVFSFLTVLVACWWNILPPTLKCVLHAVQYVPGTP